MKAALGGFRRPPARTEDGRGEMLSSGQATFPGKTGPEQEVVLDLER